MEITTEISKIFGTEMAKLFASQISEEEMNKQARAIWNELTREQFNSWGDRKDTVLQAQIKDVLIMRLHEKITEILNQPEGAEELEAKAREMVAQARKIAEEAMVHHIAENMTAKALSPWEDYARVVEQTMRALHVSNERLR